MLVFGAVVCPPKELLTPCTCDANNEVIQCTNGDFNVHTMFHRLSVSKANFSHIFKKFDFNVNYGTCFKKIRANIFGSIKFKEVVIWSCDKITEIDKYAFTSIEDTLQYLTIANSWQ